MKITRITQQVKNSERASIFIDGKYSFSLTLNELVAEKLKINQEISEAELKKLKKISDDGKLKARALEWVLNRPRSLREFSDYMYRKKADKDFSIKLAEEFEEKGYLSDEKYAVWLIDVRRRRGKSERTIQSELISKGVDREIIQQCLGSGGDELERLKELIAKKSKLPKYKTDKKKFTEYLLRQGFKYDDIKAELPLS